MSQVTENPINAFPFLTNLLLSLNVWNALNKCVKFSFIMLGRVRVNEIQAKLTLDNHLVFRDNVSHASNKKVKESDCRYAMNVDDFTIIFYGIRARLLTLNCQVYIYSSKINIFISTFFFVHTLKLNTEQHVKCHVIDIIIYLNANIWTKYLNNVSCIPTMYIELLSL